MEIENIMFYGSKNNSRGKSLSLFQGRQFQTHPFNLRYKLTQGIQFGPAMAMGNDYNRFSAPLVFAKG
jgi:hypothetical protein